MRNKIKILKVEDDKYMIKEKKWTFYPFYKFVYFTQSQFDTVDDALVFIFDFYRMSSKKKPIIILS